MLLKEELEDPVALEELVAALEEALEDPVGVGVLEHPP
jgi:hypothetical protein